VLSHRIGDRFLPSRKHGRLSKLVDQGRQRAAAAQEAHIEVAGAEAELPDVDLPTGKHARPYTRR
jgi:hypothetical protein